MNISEAAEKIEVWEDKLEEYFERSKIAHSALREAEGFRDEASEETRAFWDYQVKDRLEAARLADADTRKFKETRPREVHDLVWPFSQ